MLNYIITTSDVLRRLESFVSFHLPKATCAYNRKLIRSGAVKVNGSKAVSDQFLQLNELVTFKESSVLLSFLQDASPLLDILYEDQKIVIVNKPAGLAMHQTAELEGNLVETGMEFMEWRETPCKLYPVNRLDRGTSGVVILAKSSSSAGIYGRQVKETGLDKLYLALVCGIPDETGIITASLDGKESETRYKIIAKGNNIALLIVKPISGRTHQIRRHLEHIGHSVCGDKRYGGGTLQNYPGFALHSFRTIVQRPEIGNLIVYAPLPEGLRIHCLNNGIDTALFLQQLVFEF